VVAEFTPNFMSGSFLGGVAACLELELWLLLPFLLWKRLWPRPPLPEPLGAWSRPMVLSYLDTKIAYLFSIVELIATTSSSLQPGLQLGPKYLEQMRGLELGSAAPAPSKNRCAGSTIRSLNKGGLEPCQPML